LRSFYLFSGAFPDNYESWVKSIDLLITIDKNDAFKDLIMAGWRQ
jgi:hypothetical protein